MNMTKRIKRIALMTGKPYTTVITILNGGPHADRYSASG